MQDRYQSVLSRRRRDPDPAHGIGNQQSIAQQKANEHKPQFLKCDNLKPEVEEEAQMGTAVIRVQASDLDGADSPAGQITYSIVSTHTRFKIHPETGWLSTNTVFNRDEPDRDKLSHVTVKASDHGRPPLEAVCTLAVTIKDKNDNAPIFDRANYDVPVAQDTQRDTQIFRVSATDVDEGDNAKITYNLEATRFPADIEYFRWDDKTGAVWLNKKLDKPVGSVFVLKATALDGGTPPKSSDIDVTIEVKASSRKPPVFRNGPGANIELSEGMVDFSKPIASYSADSQIPGDSTVFFELINGRTEQTNKAATFRATQDRNNQQQVNIYVAKPLEYEKVQSYTLTLQVRNIEDLVAEAQLNVKVKDENNQAPLFNNIESGKVLEHEAPGTVVMQVSAIDNDGTYPNNRVTYSISDKAPEILDKFYINPDTGVLTTKVEFDREEKAVYAVTIIAKDGAESWLLKNGEENMTPQKFRIAIADKNDNPPYFPQQHYTADIYEDQDVGSKVIEVKAEDLDTEASLTTYSIKQGNLGLTFKIEEQTGYIRVNKPLDYESIKEYRLIVQAWDGQFANDTNVHINILNRNDMKPRFAKKNYQIDLKEEIVPTYVVFQVTATDPDIEDPNVDQNITYFLDHTNAISNHFKINKKTGALNIVKPLDRDLPNGFPKWTMFVYAKDENGAVSGLENFVEVTIDLEDINDNAPFLNMPDGLVWYENSQPGLVGKLEALDFDEEKNGPPFNFEISPKASQDIKSKFSIKKKANGDYWLKTETSFDREAQKQYEIPIKISDNQGLNAVSTLILVIGDKNDNPMYPGKSEIFVYNYEGRAPTTDIGRVYVNDSDDWDLPDKTFYFVDPSKFPDFRLNKNTGMISMRKGIKLSQETNVYNMDFKVHDPTHNQNGSKAVDAAVQVTVQRIPREAVVKSGSIRISGSAEDFVSGENSLRDKLTVLLKAYFNTTYVDVFTVIPGPNNEYTDVRFSAHGSPYFYPEKMEVNVARRKGDLEKQLGITILMIKVDECLYEGVNCPDSCFNDLVISEVPFAVMTNTTSFVGVNAVVKPECGCPVPDSVSSCASNPCFLYNDKTQEDVCEDTLPFSPERGSRRYNRGYKCKCAAENEIQYGKKCETLSASYRKGWSLHEGFSGCGNTSITFTVKTKHGDGLILYLGPSPNSVVENVTDFMALELQGGKLRLFLNFGDNLQKDNNGRIPELDSKIDDDKEHTVSLSWTNQTIRMKITEGCNSLLGCEIQLSRDRGVQKYLNTNGPLQVGGVYFGHSNLDNLAQLLSLQRHDLPNGKGLIGCIKNLTVVTGGKMKEYNLGHPSDAENHKAGCDEEFVAAIIGGMNLNFLVVILVCLTFILITVIVLALYRKRRTHFSDKAGPDDDIRENIINYEDEGGGEGDQTGYDLSVLRMTMMSGGDNGLGPMLGVGPMESVKQQHVNPSDPPDIKTFLQTNKNRMDGDPDATPFDDLRHYAYEGDGNSGGSLSSLNSGSDADADLEFEYLHNFGPRFKKLADMYGQETDSEEEEGVDNPAFRGKPGQGASESWC